ncbi:MAG: YdcF family protein [Clostridia bacterium]|nr:YdcF family protein [Clostridia bacterium]
MKQKMKKIIWILITCAIVGAVIVFGINAYVKATTKNKIIKDGDFSALENIDCVIILGAGIWGDKPSPMLEDRLLEGIKLYKDGVVDKILATGDHGQNGYDEVSVMKKYIMEQGVPSEDIFMDHAGFSTYESMYRAKAVFDVENAIVVTQEYHLYRAIYIANQLGLNVLGAPSDPRQYAGQAYRDIREILARNKDFIQCIFKFKPTYLGEVISVFGDGNLTNDDKFNKFLEGIEN